MDKPISTNIKCTVILAVIIIIGVAIITGLKPKTCRQGSNDPIITGRKCAIIHAIISIYAVTVVTLFSCLLDIIATDDNFIDITDAATAIIGD